MYTLNLHVCTGIPKPSLVSLRSGAADSLHCHHAHPAGGYFSGCSASDGHERLPQCASKYAGQQRSAFLFKKCIKKCIKKTLQKRMYDNFCTFLQLPFALIPILTFTSLKSIMNDFANQLWVKFLLFFKRRHDLKCLCFFSFSFLKKMFYDIDLFPTTIRFSGPVCQHQSVNIKQYRVTVSQLIPTVTKSTPPGYIVLNKRCCFLSIFADANVVPVFLPPALTQLCLPPGCGRFLVVSSSWWFVQSTCTLWWFMWRRWTACCYTSSLPSSLWPTSALWVTW